VGGPVHEKVSPDTRRVWDEIQVTRDRLLRMTTAMAMSCQTLSDQMRVSEAEQSLAVKLCEQAQLYRDFRDRLMRYSD